MTEKEKINFEVEILGRKFKFKNVKMDRNEYNGSVNYFAPMGAVSSVVRQYVKQRWPQVGKFNFSSDSFSMGDSVSIYLNDVSEDLYKEISNELTMIFQRGRFNGMEDIYEYSDKETRVTVPLPAKYEDEPTIDTKWMTVQNRPKFGTKLWKEFNQKQVV